ncbi:MAG: phosphoenolpyruvate--protein phosphotransferase [Deltaproteobacteria bacterium]|nr:phosphoenolpyruvate--protein phosphotransferase [Deltaproteobacteria bacterium]
MPKTKKRDHLNLLCDIGDLATLLTGSSNIENFLQRTAVMVSRHLEADVCSIYLFDDQARELVLKATIGLNPEAVNNVRMKSGEGLVGCTLIKQQPIREGSASRNPQFKYFEEAGEDRFESFLSVPISRGIENIGVLVVQHEKRDYFDEMDVMALRAAASQLASAIENARLLMSMNTPQSLAVNTAVLEQLKFIRGESAGIGYARAPSTIFGKSHDWLLSEVSECDADYTLKHFYRAIQLTIDQLQELQSRVAERLPESASLIFTAHFMILKDERFIQEIIQHIEKGVPPPEAVRMVARHYIALFSSSPYMYLREKVNDMEDLAGRILANFQLRDMEAPLQCKGRIVIARELYPSDILKLASEEVAGIILVSGGVTSHVAILARSMQIPLIIADRPELLTLPEETAVLMDAASLSLGGNIYVNPSEKVIQQFESRNLAKAETSLLADAMTPITETRDGQRIHLLANINLLSELALARDLKAEGIGLYRSEFPFLIRNNFPSEQEQYPIYKRLFDEMPDKTITIRTLDVGGDKILAYSDATGESNPELGLRSIRFSLRNPDIFEQQIKAILRAGAEAKSIRIMFPMISSVDEFKEARALVEDCGDDLQRQHLSHHPGPKIGMMIELPSVMEIMDTLAVEADFFSIGTNDFVQYMLAVDRTNEKVAEYYQPWHPSVLRSLARIVSIVIQQNKEISICGEMAHEPEYISFFLGIGVRNLSVDPQFLPLVQRTIRRLSLTDAIEYARNLLSESTLKGTREIMDRYLAAA